MMHKKRWAAFVLAAALVLTGCSFLHFGKGSGGSTAQKIDRPAVESAEEQFAHPAARGHRGSVRHLGWRVPGGALPG